VTERHRDTETQRQRHRDIERQRDTETEGQRDTEAERQILKDRQTVNRTCLKRKRKMVCYKKKLSCKKHCDKMNGKFIVFLFSLLLCKCPLKQKNFNWRNALKLHQ
jgi:hypothetical protein